MRTIRLTKEMKAMRRVNDERTWIKQCGETLAGYIANYGSRDDPDHYGAGGEAIYKADMDALAAYEREAGIRH